MGSSANIAFTPYTPGPAWQTDAYNIAARVLRSCKTVREAVEFMKRPEIAGHGNHILTDPSGDMVCVEKAGSTLVAVRKPDEAGFICCLNYFMGEYTDEERMKNVPEMNLDRIGAMKRHRATLTETNGEEVVRAFLSDSTQGKAKYAVSQHACIGMICFPRKREMLACDGPPHLSPFYSFSLK